MATDLTNPVPRKKVAIIGAGCAGIGALWALNRTHHDVYLYEAAGRLGGHINTVEFKNGKYKAAVDTGFIVLNTATYPNFLSFLNTVKVPTEPTEMSFSVSRNHGMFEWAGTSLGSVFAQTKNIFSPRMWRMIFDIIRFNQFALDLLAKEKHQVFVNGDGHNDEYDDDSEESIGEYLEREGYSAAFRDDYLVPMTAAIWSTSPDKCALEFPAVTLVRFMWNHNLLTVVGTKPQWLTLKEGSKSYIDAVMKGFPPNHLFLSTPVVSISNDSSGHVLVHRENGNIDSYDHVILAIHGDQALQLISASATPMENSILSAFKASRNTAILHSDISLMPKTRSTWSAWNYLTLSSSPTTMTPSRTGNIDQVCVTYNMNILQHIPTSAFGDVLVTLNPLYLPPPSKIQGEFSYTHTLHTAAATRSQELLSQIQNTRGVSYCGAWTKYGSHEDGFSSGLKVAMEHLGARLPFEFRDSTHPRGRRPILGFGDYALRLWILWAQLFVAMLEKLARAAKERGERFKTVMVKQKQNGMVRQNGMAGRCT